MRRRARGNRATRANTPAKRPGAVSAGLLGLVALLALPSAALHHQRIDPIWAGVYVLIVSTLTFWCYAVDKRRAEEGHWRIPEAQLHFLELVGGWPGAWLGQRLLRHKTVKLSYQAVFWLIVIVYQVVSFDALQEWRLYRAAVQQLNNTSYQRRSVQ